MSGPRWRPLQATAFAGIVGATLVVASLSLVNIWRWSAEPIFGLIRSTGRAPTVGLVLAHGREAGLEVGDRILAVNGHPVASLGELRAFRRTEPGSSNTYAVQRGARPLTLTIPTRPLGMRDALLVFGLSWTVGLVFVALGVVVFLMKPYGRAAWAFLLFSVVTGTFVLFIHRNVLHPPWLATVSLASLGFLPAVLLHLGLTFPEERDWLARRRAGLLVPYGLSLALVLLLARSAPSWEDIPAGLKTAWLAYLGLAIAGLLTATAYTHWRAASAIARLRARVVLLGFTLATCVPVAESVLNAVGDVYLLPHSTWVLPFFVLVPLSIGYAIVKHDLFDIDAVIRRTTGYVLLTGVIVAVYASLLGGLNLVFRQWAAVPPPAAAGLTVLILTLVLHPLRDRVQGLVDRIFYRTPSDYRHTVPRITKALTAVIALDVVVDRVLRTLTGEMFVGAAAVLLRDEADGAYAVYRVEGARAAAVGRVRLDGTSPIVELFSAGSLDLIAREAVAEDPRVAPWRARLLDDLDRLDAALAIPLAFTGELIGLLAVGDRLSGRTYSAEDVTLLTTLAHESAIAIHNALAFKKIEDLTLTLEARVRQRTEELAALNARLEESNERLRDLDRLKSEFVSDVAHELRTPLTSITGYVDHVLDGAAGEVTPAQKEFLGRVRSNAERLTRLIADLLDLARIEAGRADLHLARLAVPAVVEEVIDDLRGPAAARTIALGRTIAPADLAVTADRDKLYQILLNLAHNAVKFTDPGGRVRVSAGPGDGGTVVIAVEDTGRGIAPEELEQVFEKFSQAGDQDAERTGSGLGLTITRKLVELHGGTIRATSAPGRGSTFTVTLPAAGPPAS